MLMCPCPATASRLTVSSGSAMGDQTDTQSVRRRIGPYVGFVVLLVLVWLIAPLANVEGLNILRLEVAGSAEIAQRESAGVSPSDIDSALLGDLLLIVAYAALLIFGVWSFRGGYRVRRFREFAPAATGLTLIAAALDLTENFAIHQGLSFTSDLPWQIAACCAWAKFVILILVGLYVVVAAFTYLLTPGWLRREMKRPLTVDADVGEPRGRIFGIAASGGGVRSASLVLGSLQGLDDAYPNPGSPGPSWTSADKVTAVSGGSYIAGAFAIARSARAPLPETPPRQFPHATQPPCQSAWRIRRLSATGGGQTVADGVEEEHLLTRLGYLLAPNPSGQPRPTNPDRPLDEAVRESRDVPGLIALVGVGAALNLAVLVGILWLVLQPYGWLLHSDPEENDPVGGTTHALLECVPHWSSCLSQPGLVLPVVVWAAATGVCLLAWVGAGWVRAAFRPGSRPHTLVVQLNRHGRNVVLGLLALTAVLAVGLLLIPTLVAALDTVFDEARRALTPAAAVAAVGAVASLISGLRGKAARFAPYVGGAFFVALLTLVSAQILASVSVQDWPWPHWIPEGMRLQEELTHELRWAGWLLVAGLAYLVVSAEWWSMAGFYRARLRLAFATYRVRGSVARAYLNGSHPRELAEPSVYELQPRSDENRLGSPLLVCTTAHASAPEVRTHHGLPAVSVTIGPDRVRMNLPGKGKGTVSASTREVEQLLYRRGGARLTTMLTVGVSGAAISPAMGRYRIGPTRALLAAANVRLGVWVPNPRYAKEQPENVTELARPERPYRRVSYPRPRLSYLLKEMFGIHDLDDPYIYLTDGGHWENTGLVELIRDSDFSEVVCIDADEKPRQTVTQIAQAINLATLECDTTIKLSLDPLRGPADAGRGGDYSPQSVALGLIHRGNRVGLLWYAKPVLTADTPLDLLSYAECDPDFPATSTIDQFFHIAQFKAYRDLGRFNARQIVIARYELAQAMRGVGFERFRQRAREPGAHWAVVSAAKLLTETSYPQIAGIFGDLAALRLAAESARGWPNTPPPMRGPSAPSVVPQNSESAEM